MTQNVASGTLDRRILIQLVDETKDAAGDVVGTGGTDLFKLWARRTTRGPGTELPTAPGVIRQYDVMWEVRDGSKSRSIAPETHRVLYRGRVYEIVGILPGLNRDDLVTILTSSRPDHRGSRGNEGVSGQP